jgi:hypothetical protein
MALFRWSCACKLIIKMWRQYFQCMKTLHSRHVTKSLSLSLSIYIYIYIYILFLCMGSIDYSTISFPAILMISVVTILWIIHCVEQLMISWCWDY